MTTLLKPLVSSNSFISHECRYSLGLPPLK
jgi:hypothetical protein